MNPVSRMVAGLLASGMLAAPVAGACVSQTTINGAQLGELDAVLTAGQERCARTGAGFAPGLVAFRAASAAALSDAGVRLGQNRLQRVVQTKAEDARYSCSELRRLAHAAAAGKTLEELVAIARAYGVSSPSTAEPCAPLVQVAARP